MSIITRRRPILGVRQVERLVVLGAGGHARIVIDALQEAGAFELAGVVAPSAGEPVLPGVAYLGSDDDLALVFASGVTACAVAVGSVGDVSRRERLFAEARRLGFHLPPILHPAAAVSHHARVADGAYVGPGAVVCAGASLGEACIVNTGAVVDHDCVVGAFAHLAPGVTLSGDVRVGHGTHVGTGSSVAQRIAIGAHTLVGVGSAVVDDLPDGVMAYGVPCRVVRSR